VIDTGAGLLQNVITFPPGGAFIVDSGIAVGGASSGGHWVPGSPPAEAGQAAHALLAHRARLTRPLCLPIRAEG
jgi:hypothetical protein